MDAVERYLSVVKAEWPERNVGNLRFYLEYLFDGVPLTGRRVLDIGAGDGVYSFYAAAAGAARVTALEPEAAGATLGVTRRFARLGEAMGLASVDLRTETFQDFDPGDDRFDVLFMHAVINHLDEPSTIAIDRDEAARETYRSLFSKLAAIGAPGAKLVASDAARRHATVESRLYPLPRAYGDKVHLQQVLLNLILNGLEAMVDTPRSRRRLIVFAGRTADGDIEVCVSDCGHGIAPERMFRIFDSFLSTKPDGMGLGLSGTKRLVDEFEIDTAPGAGTRVRILKWRR